VGRIAAQLEGLDMGYERLANVSWSIIETGRRRLVTHLVQALMRIQTVHVSTQNFVNCIRLLHPLVIRMDISHEFSHIHHQTQDVTQAIE
jgi:hypothetical protein